MKKALLLSLTLCLAASVADARGRHGKPKPDPLEGKDFAAVLAVMTDASASHELRSSAAYRIHQFGDKRAIPALLNILDKEQSLRYEAIHSLGELRAKEAVEPIVDLIIVHIVHGDDTKEDLVDHNAEMTEGTEALGKIGEVKGLRGALPMLAQEEHAYRRQVAVRAIAAISEAKGTPAEIRSELATPVFTHLIDPANEKDSSVRLEAVFGLSHLKAQSASAALHSACESDEDSRVRYAAQRALVDLKQSCDPLKPIRQYLPPELKDKPFNP